MPIIVDRDQIRRDILMAFQRCIERKPMMNVSLRDIAAEAGMSHAKLLNYFESKNDLILAYVRYTREYMCEKCSQWFAEHDRADYDSNLAYMNAFMDYVANAPSHCGGIIRSSSGYFRAGDSPKRILSDCIHGRPPHELRVVEKRPLPRLFLCRLHAALFLPEQHFPPALHPFLTVPLTGYKLRPFYRSIYSNHRQQGRFLSAPASPEAQRASADPAYRPHRQT